ncbi:MAG: hypothetical protein AAF747_10240 [Planctomycetota bacterium]
MEPDATPAQTEAAVSRAADRAERRAQRRAIAEQRQPLRGRPIISFRSHPRFHGATFGPLDIRSVLRVLCARDERLVAWAVVQPKTSATKMMMTAGLGVLPGIGQIITWTMLANETQQRRLMILTDRRLIALRLDRTGPRIDGRGVTFDESLGLLHVASPDLGVARTGLATPTRFSLTTASGRAVHFEVVKPRARSTRRFVEAMVDLAEHDSGLAPPRDNGKAGAPAAVPEQPWPESDDAGRVA